MPKVTLNESSMYRQFHNVYEAIWQKLWNKTFQENVGKSIRKSFTFALKILVFKNTLSNVNTTCEVILFHTNCESIF